MIVIWLDYGDFWWNFVVCLELCWVFVGWGCWVWEVWSGGFVKFCLVDGFVVFLVIYFGRWCVCGDRFWWFLVCCEELLWFLKFVLRVWLLVVVVWLLNREVFVYLFLISKILGVYCVNIVIGEFGFFNFIGLIGVILFGFYDLVCVGC